LQFKHYPEDSLDNDLLDFGFHYANNMSEISSIASFLELYQMLPANGNYFDQDSELMLDVVRYTVLKRHIERTEFTDKEKRW
jgi:hypothetical protein